MKKRATMQQIASEVGLSRPGVSYALSPDWRRRGIAKATRERVLHKAVELGYRRNRIATSLRTGTTKNIGVLVPSIAGEFYSQMLGGIESVIPQYHLLLGVSEYDVPREEEVLETFRDCMVDGLIVISAGRRENLAVLRRFQNEGVPIVQAERFFDDFKTDIVEADNVGIGFMLTKHLLDLGHRRVVFIRGIRQVSSSLSRIEGYEKAMREHGLAPKFSPERLSKTDESSNFVFAQRQMRRFLDEEKPPFGIVAHDFQAGYGALKAIHAAGLKCPRDVSLCAGGIEKNDPASEFLRPKLTMAEWSVWEVGARAAQTLLRRLQSSEGHAPELQHIAVTAHLVMGESTASPT